MTTSCCIDIQIGRVVSEHVSVLSNSTAEAAHEFAHIFNWISLDIKVPPDPLPVVVLVAAWGTASTKTQIAAIHASWKAPAADAAEGGVRVDGALEHCTVEGDLESGATA